VLVMDLDDAIRVRAAGASKLIGAAGKKALEASRHRENPVPAGRLAHIAVAVFNTPGQVYQPTDPDFGPLTIRKIADPPFGDQEHLILIVVNVERRPSAWRGQLRSDREPPTGLLTAEHDRKRVAEGVEISAPAGLDDGGCRLLIFHNPILVIETTHFIIIKILNIDKLIAYHAVAFSSAPLRGQIIESVKD
jgi:hypothetical protein